MARVTRTRLAQQDLEEILDYLDRQGGDAAERFAGTFDDTCEHYANNPLLGTSATECAANFRHFTVWNYAIFFRPMPGGIEIIRIIHGARDIPSFFESGLGPERWRREYRRTCRGPMQYMSCDALEDETDSGATSTARG